MITSKRQNIAGSKKIFTFRGVATVDSDNILRTFRLDNLETLREEIVSASTKRLQNISIPDFFLSNVPVKLFCPADSINDYFTLAPNSKFNPNANFHFCSKTYFRAVGRSGNVEGRVVRWWR